MQAVQIITYPIQLVLMKCRACIHWILSAWRGMFTRRPINMRNSVPTGGAHRPMPRIQRIRLLRTRSVPINTEYLPRRVPLKRRASPEKVVHKNYYRPAVIPLKWSGGAPNTTVSDNLEKPEETSLKVAKQTLQVPQNEMEAKLPKYEDGKKWQKPVDRGSATSSAMREDGNIKSGAKLVPKGAKDTPFVNKRWSY